MMWIHGVIVIEKDKPGVLREVRWDAGGVRAGAELLLETHKPRVLPYKWGDVDTPQEEEPQH